MKLNLKTKLILGIFFKSALFVLIFITVNIIHERNLIKRHVLDKANTIISLLAESSADDLANMDLLHLRLSLADLEKDPQIIHAYVFDADGKILADGTEENNLRDRVLNDFAVQEAIRTQNRSMRWEKDSLHIAQSISLSGKKIGGVAIGFSLEVMHQTLVTVFAQNISLAVLFLLASVLFAYFVSVKITRPISDLARGTQEISRGNFNYQIKVKSEDEIGALSKAFNRMAEDIQKTTVSRDELLKEIEERKRLQNVLLQSEKMAAIGQLAGGVAHEINNPLGVILGFSQNVVKRLQPGDPLEMPLKSIEREAVRCKNLVQDLLTFSRVGKTEKEPVDLKEAIESALSLIRAQSKVKDVEMRKEFFEVPAILGNKNQIQQIVVNLANNAIDAMPKGGKLSIKVQKAKMENREGVEIQVQDTGHGIPEEIRSKIFNPFFTTKEVGKGTGLGLSLVYEIVEKHEGKIHLESEIDKGTTFHIFFPLDSSK